MILDMTTERLTILLSYHICSCQAVCGSHTEEIQFGPNIEILKLENDKSHNSVRRHLPCNKISLSYTYLQACFSCFRLRILQLILGQGNASIFTSCFSDNFKCKSSPTTSNLENVVIFIDSCLLKIIQCTSYYQCIEEEMYE